MATKTVVEDLPVVQPVSKSILVVTTTKERPMEVPMEKRVAIATSAELTARLNLAWMQMTIDPY